MCLTEPADTATSLTRPAEVSPDIDPCDSYSALLDHELRVPATALWAYLELLQDDGLLDDPQLLRQYLALVRGRAADLARAVSELTTVPVPAPLGSTVGDAHMTLPALVQHLRHGRPLRLEASADAAVAAVDVGWVAVALGQVLDHAFAESGAGVDVLLRATVDNEPPHLVIRVMHPGESRMDGTPGIVAGGASTADREATPPRGPNPDPSHHARAEKRAAWQQRQFGLAIAARAMTQAGGLLAFEPGRPATVRLEVPLTEEPIARQARARRERAAQADGPVLHALRDLRALREVADHERKSREMAEAQQLRLVADFRLAHRQALALTQRLDRAYLETITGLARAVEARDRYTGGHIERVQAYSLSIAERLEIDGEARRHLEFGAVLHDIGKIGVPDEILRKPGPLDPEEWRVMRQHPDLGRRVLEGISFLTPALDAVAAHHERWDGRGYPGGLAGEAIPLAGRIVSVADAFDAMASDRHYRQGLPIAVALREIEQGSGTQFEPQVVRAFVATRQSNSRTA